METWPPGQADPSKRLGHKGQHHERNCCLCTCSRAWSQSRFVLVQRGSTSRCWTHADTAVRVTASPSTCCSLIKASPWQVMLLFPIANASPVEGFPEAPEGLGRCQDLHRPEGPLES